MSKQADEELIEKLAAIEHGRWASWQNYLHSFLTWNKDLQAWVLPHEQKDRWQMQVNTPYAMLSEKEKQSDRDEVMRYWPLIAARESAIRREAKQREVGAETEELKQIYDIIHSGEDDVTEVRAVRLYVDYRLKQLTAHQQTEGSDG